MKNRKIIAVSALMIAATGAQAQGNARDTVIRASTIEISQVYKPEVRQAVKQEYAPALPPADRSTASFNYTVPQQSLYYSYRSLPLRPLSLGRDSVVVQPGNYIKAGLGNLRTLYLDAGISALKGRNFESYIHAGLLSQKNSDLKYQQHTVAALNASGVYHAEKYDWQLDADLLHASYKQYGFDRQLYAGLVPGEPTLNGGRVALAMIPKKSGALSFRPDVYAAFYTGRFITNEVAAGFRAPFTYTIDSAWQLNAGLAVDMNKLQSESYNVESNVLKLSAGFRYHKEDFSLRMMFSPALGQGQNWYLLPDVEGRYELPEWQMHIGAGIQGNLVQNSYAQLFLHNPFLSVFPSLQTHSNEVYAYGQKGLGNHLTLSARLSWWQYNYLPMYLNLGLPRGEEFAVVYEPKVNALSLQAGLRYQVATDLSVGVNLLVYNYYKLSHSSRIWQTPANRLNGDLMWRPVEQLQVTAYAAFVDQNYAVAASGAEVKIPSYVDIGLGGEYALLQRWSVFLNINNLLNNHYQRWYGYDAYGINIYGGLRFKF